MTFIYTFCSGPFVRNDVSFALSLFVIILILDLDPTPAGEMSLVLHRKFQNVPTAKYLEKLKFFAIFRKRSWIANISLFWDFIDTVYKLFGNKIKSCNDSKNYIRFHYNFERPLETCWMLNTWVMMGYKIWNWMLWNHS